MRLARQESEAQRISGQGRSATTDLQLVDAASECRPITARDGVLPDLARDFGLLIIGGRYWARTSDLCRVKAALYQLS